MSVLAEGMVPNGEAAASANVGAGDRGGRLPRVAELCVGSMALIIAGGIYVAAHLPHRAPFGPAVGLLVASGAILLVNVASLARVRDFAWRTFRMVTGWAALAYLVVTGMLEYIFVLDGTRGSMLVLLTLMLLVFAVNVPLILGFSVARYQPVEPGT
ncbi:MAG: hypothetical protein ACRDV4_07275 [Acidimicrobiales bacterium]